MKRLASIASAVACLAAAPAFAASTATATLDNIQITLYKLNPLLAGATSITFSDTALSYGNYVSASAFDNQSGQLSSVNASGATAFDPVSVNTTGVSNAWASANVSGPGTAIGSSLSASGTALGTATGGAHSNFQASADSSYFYNQNFTLSANTVALFSVTASLSATVTATFDPAASGQPEHASAYSSLSIDGVGALGAGSQSTSNHQSIASDSQSVADPSCTSGYCYVGQSQSRSTGLSGSFINATANTLAGNMYATAAVNGYSNAALVPEPSSYALMLAGLASIGFIARRRRG